MEHGGVGSGQPPLALDSRPCRTHRQVRDQGQDHDQFPKINDAFTGRANRYAYAVAFPVPWQQTCGLVKYDMHSDSVDRLVLPEGDYAGEPCFVPDPEGQAEDDGWLLSFVTDLHANIGELWIIDARDICKPVGSIEIPVWTPAGVHGSWIDDSAI